MSYCLSLHDRYVLEKACEKHDWDTVLMLLRYDADRRARAANDGWTPSERRWRDGVGPFDRKRDDG